MKPATCFRCTNILLEEHDSFSLGSLGFMVFSTCSGCRFFVNVAQRYGFVLEDETRTQMSMRRSFKDANLVDVDYVGNKSGESNTIRTHKFRLCSTFGFELPFSADFEGLDDRYLGSWFERCTKSHGSACALPADVALPTRLIHISPDDPSKLNLCITRGMRGHYVALSYSWGKGNTFKTTAQTIDRLMSGFVARELPTTLRDAVVVAHRLGYEWIWIDQLCILQDSLEDWSREASRMAQVYSNSAFTVCADSTQSADETLFEERRVLQSHSFGLNEAMCLQTTFEPWEGMTQHPLYRRGWAFQERVLSSRNLHFFYDQIAWECNSTLYFEDSRGRQTKPVGHFAKEGFTELYHQKPSTDSSLTDIDIVRRIGAWNSILQEMAVRELSFRSDKLPAMSGMASALEIPEMGEYLAGVWSYNPFISMAWFPRFPQQRPNDYYSPSWSCAWTRQQIVWYYDTWRGGDDMPSTVAMIDWKLWDNEYGPRLLHHNIVKKDYDPKGEVLEGSSMTIVGHCRPIYVADVPGAGFDSDLNEVAIATGQVNKPGRRICMDENVRTCDFVCLFTPSFPNVSQAFDRHSIKQYLAVQIVRERKERWQKPKVIGLVLDSVPEFGEGAFRRVGLTDFDEPLEYG